MYVTDITESIKNTNRYNFHSHTEFSDGHAPMATMAEAAAGDGFEMWNYIIHVDQRKLNFIFKNIIGSILKMVRNIFLILYFMTAI